MKKFMLTVGALGLLSGCGSFYVIDGTGGKQVKINGKTMTGSCVSVGYNFFGATGDFPLRIKIEGVAAIKKRDHDSYYVLPESVRKATSSEEEACKESENPENILSIEERTQNQEALNRAEALTNFITQSKELCRIWQELDKAKKTEPQTLSPEEKAKSEQERQAAWNNYQSLWQQKDTLLKQAEEAAQLKRISEDSRKKLTDTQTEANNTKLCQAL